MKFQLVVVNVLNFTKPQLTCVWHNWLKNVWTRPSPRSLQVCMAGKKKATGQGHSGLQLWRRMNSMQTPPLGWPHTIQSVSIQINSISMAPHSPSASFLTKSPSFLTKSKVENTVFRSSTSMQLCPWLYTWNARMTLDSSLGSSKNFRPQFCQLVVFVMLSISQSLLLTKMSRRYTSTPPPCSSFKYTLDYRSGILPFSSDFLHLIYFLSHIQNIRSIKAIGTIKTIESCSLSLR